MRSSIEFKLLTDVDAGFVRKDTFDALTTSPNTEIRTLLSLHAKIYIIEPVGGINSLKNVRK